MAAVLPPACCPPSRTSDAYIYYITDRYTYRIHYLHCETNVFTKEAPRAVDGRWRAHGGITARERAVNPLRSQLYQRLQNLVEHLIRFADLLSSVCVDFSPAPPPPLLHPIGPQLSKPNLIRPLTVGHLNRVTLNNTPNLNVNGQSNEPTVATIPNCLDSPIYCRELLVGPHCL